MKFSLELLYPCVRRVLKKQSKTGFTLIELMVVIATVAVLAGVTAPNFINYLQEAGLKQAVYQISGDLHRTKSQAIRARSNQTITFSQVANTYLCSSPLHTINLADFWGSVIFTNNPDGGLDVFSPTIAFNTRGLSGLVPAVTTQVYLANQVAGPLGVGNGRIFRVQVSAAGAVSIHEWRGGRWIQ